MQPLWLDILCKEGQEEDCDETDDDDACKCITFIRMI